MKTLTLKLKTWTGVILASFLSVLVMNTNAQTYFFKDTVTCYNWDNPNSEWDDSYREIYAYDANGNDTLYVYQTFNGTNWENSSKQEKTYNASNKILSKTNYTWTSGNWHPIFKEENTYDANNNLLQKLYFNYSSTWDSSFRIIYTYNSSNLEIQSIGQSYSSGTWVNTGLNSKSYDGNGNLLTDTSKTWDGSSNIWINSQINLYTYNSGNYVLTNIYQVWDTLTSTWDNISKSEYEYNSSNSLTRNTIFNWNNMTPAWDTSFRMNYVYDANQKEIEFYNESYQGGVWHKVYRYTKSYDVNDNLLLRKNYNWSNVINDWEISSQDSNMYNTNNLLTEWIYGNYISGNYVNSSRCVYVYESITFTGIEDEGVNTVSCIMANPYNGQNIQCNLDPAKTYRLNLFDLQGRIIYATQIAGGNTFTLDPSIQNGLYIMQLQSMDGKEMMNKKLLIAY